MHTYPRRPVAQEVSRNEQAMQKLSKPITHEADSLEEAQAAVQQAIYKQQHVQVQSTVLEQVCAGCFVRMCMCLYVQVHAAACMSVHVWLFSWFRTKAIEQRQLSKAFTELVRASLLVCQE